MRVLSKKRSDVVYRLIPIIFFSSFVMVQIWFLFHDFRGFYSVWDYGDFDARTIRSYANADIYATNYPPAAVMIYHIIGRMFLNGSIEENAMKYLAFIYNSLILFSIYFLNRYFLKEYPCGEAISVSLLLQYPLFFAIERGNLIMVAFVLAYLFIAFHESKSRTVRLAGYFCMAVSVNIKIYPVVYFWLLLRKKRYRAVAVCVLMSVALFMVPAIVLKITDGQGIMENIRLYIRALSGFSEGVSEQVYTTSVKHLVARAFVVAGLGGAEQMPLLENMALVLYLVWTGILLLLSKRDADTLLLLSLLCVFVPEVSFWYSLIFLIIPFVFFLREMDVKRKSDILMLVLYVLLLILVFDNRILRAYGPIRLVLLFLVVSYRVIADFIQNRKLQKA